jgi:hypothetical protein
MTYHTAAQVSGTAIRLAISKKKFSIGDLQSELTQDVDLELIHQVLHQLESDGWIKESSSSSLTLWQSGPLARELGDTVKFSRDDEGTISVLPDEEDY